MDKVTEEGKRGSYARVLVEINFAKEVVREVTMNFEDGEAVECKMVYENEPFYRKGCPGPAQGQGQSGLRPRAQFI